MSLDDLLEAGAVNAAQSLIGWKFYTTEADGTKTGGTIVETEAYTQEDAASHSYRGQTPRTEIMFGPAGYLYVYFTYGMHWCANIVTGKIGHGEAVLLRAILPEEGRERILERRDNPPNSKLTDGPAKLCQALAITGADKGAKLNESKFLLRPPTEVFKTQATERIGIRNDTHRLWRFIVRD